MKVTKEIVQVRMWTVLENIAIIAATVFLVYSVSPWFVCLMLFCNDFKLFKSGCDGKKN